jgi:FkbM family methyltransferase
MNLRTYLRELRFALSASTDLKSLAALLKSTAAFHLSNLQRRGSDLSAKDLKLNLKVGNTPRTITLRPKSGDRFILYEVLAFDSYKIASDAVDPLQVRAIVDCGANIGLTALYLAERYPNARIFCVEPDPRNFALLKANTSAEPRITAIQAAVVGKSQGPIYLSQDRPAWGNSISATQSAQNAIAVDSIMIGDIMAKYDVPKIDLLKVDIEGAEEGLFAHAQFLEHVGFVVIELHGDYTYDRFSADVAPYQFRVHRPGAFGGVHAYTAHPISKTGTN